MAIETNGIKKDKETHTPMLKVFKDLMRIKNDNKEHPEKTSLLEKKYIENNVNAYHTKNVDNERIYSDTSYSACACAKGSTGSPKKRQGIEICDSLYLRRYGKSDVKKDKKKYDKEEKRLKSDKKHRSNEFKEQTFQLGSGLRREGSKSRYYKKMERQDSTISDRSCCIKKIIQAADCQTLVLFVMMAIAVALALGYCLRGIQAKKHTTNDMLMKSLNHGTVKAMKMHKSDSDYNIEDDVALSDHRKDSDMLKDWSINNVMNNAEFAADELMGENYDEKSSQPGNSFDSLNFIKFDYDASNSKLKNFYNKLLQIDATIEKLKTAKTDSYMRAKRSLRFKRRRRYHNKINNKKRPTNATLDAATTVSNTIEVTNETKLSSAHDMKELEAVTANTAASDEVLVKVIVQPGRKSKCSHVNTVNPKSHEKELKHPYYKITQRVDELLDPKAEYAIQTTNNDETLLTVTAKVEKNAEKSKNNNIKDDMNQMKTNSADATDISMDYYMGLPILYFDNYKDSSSRHSTRYQELHQKTNMRSLLQANENYDDSIQYGELQDAAKEDVDSNSDKDSISNKNIFKKFEKAFHEIKNLQKSVDTDKQQVNKMHNPGINTNWKGPIALYPDEIKALSKNTQKSQRVFDENVQKADKNYDVLVNEDGITDRDDLQYVEDPSDDTQKSAQCYSDYGVLDNEKKEIKYNKNPHYTKIPISGDLTISSSPYHPYNIPRYINNRYKMNDLIKVFPHERNNLEDDFYKDFQDVHGINEDKIVKQNKNTGARRKLMSIDDTGNTQNQLLKNEPQDHYDDYEDYLSYDYSVPPTETNILYIDKTNKTKENNVSTEASKSQERAKRYTTENYKNTNAVVINATESPNNFKFKKETTQNNSNDTGLVKNNKFVDFMANIFSSLSKSASSKKNNCSCNFKSTEKVPPTKVKDAIKRITRISVLSDDINSSDRITTIGLENIYLNISTTTDTLTNTNLATIETVTNGSVIETKATEDIEIDANKTIVKRNAPIADSGFIFWNELYDDNYGIETDLAEYGNATDVRRARRNKTSIASCRGWIHDRINNIKNKFHFRVMNENSKQGKDESNKLNQVLINDSGQAEEFVLSTGKRVQRDINDDLRYTVASDVQTVDASTHHTAPFEKEQPSKISFAKLTANLKEVCKQAAQAVHPVTKVHGRENVDSDGRTNLIMNQLVRMMTNMIDEQVQQKTCLSLPKDLQKFLHQLTARDPEPENFEDDDAANNRKVNEQEKRRDSFQVNPAELDIDPSLDHKSKCLDVLREVQALQTEFDRFSDDEKQTLVGVKEYLDSKQSFILDQLQDHLLPATDTEQSRFRKEARHRHHRHLRPNLLKRNAFKFIKKSGKKHTKPTTTENLSTEPLGKAKTHDKPAPHHMKRYDAPERAYRSHDATESDDVRDGSQFLYNYDSASLGVDADRELDRQSSPVFEGDDKNYGKRNLKDVYFKAVSEANKVISTIRTKHRISKDNKESGSD